MYPKRLILEDVELMKLYPYKVVVNNKKREIAHALSAEIGKPSQYTKLDWKRHLIIGVSFNWFFDNQNTFYIKSRRAALFVKMSYE